MTSAAKIKTLILLITALMMFGQCSRHSGRSLLTIFFDGVPEEDSSSLAFMEPELISGDSASTAGGLEEPGTGALLVHFPYAERECATCHDPNSLGTMLEPQPDLCYMCHEDYSMSYPYLHGPVAGGYCTSCHHPHLSEKAHLLRFTGSELCYYCHRKERVLKNDMHTDLEGMDCCDCHNAHGGEDRYIFQ